MEDDILNFKKKNYFMILEEKMIVKGGIKLLFVKLIKKKQNNFKKKNIIMEIKLKLNINIFFDSDN